MFGTAKPLASLSSGLLARKGQARPAMRPQGFASLTDLASAGEALGWNDMGDAPMPAPAKKPVVLAEREALMEEFPGPVFVATPPAAARVIDVSVRTAERLRRETSHKRKAAFTLRLDEDRHLRLRLAAATRNQSAQVLVTEALDTFLSTMPEVEALIAQLPPKKTR